MRLKALSPNNMIGRHLNTQNRVVPLKCQKKDKGHHKDEQAKLFFLKTAKQVPQQLSSISMKQVQQSRSSLTRLHPTIDMTSDDNLEG
jgi:hypothetical protein